MSLVLAIRTADRSPGPAYIGRTVRGLLQQGVSPDDIHVFPTSPDIAWMREPMADLAVTLHVPTAPRNPNENGRALVTVLDTVAADWLLMLEDDVQFCADFVGSVERWLRDHERPDVHVYRFCAFGALAKQGATFYEYPLREQRGSQAVALRAADARAFAQWAAEHHTQWRPAMAPFQNQRTNGFDKLIGYWALATWPKQKVGLVSRPQLVRHVGIVSGIHRARPSIRNDSAWAGTGYTYEGAECR